MVAVGLAMLASLGPLVAAPPSVIPADIPRWRSALYPEDWTPGFTGPDGRFLHDVSFAGYRGGGVPLGQDLALRVIDVVAQHGADPTGTQDSTAAIQRAIAAAEAAGGAVVHVPRGLYRVDGTLEVRGDRVVLRGEGPDLSRIEFTASEGMSYRSHLTFRGAMRHVTELPLTEDGAPRSAELRVADASLLRTGDDVDVGWVVSDAWVEEHGMTGTWSVFNGAWQPFFRRQVVAVDTAANPHRVLLDVPLRYAAQVRDGASLRVAQGYLQECGLEGLGLSNAVDREAAWAQDQVHAVALHEVKDCWVRDVATFPSRASDDLVRGERAHLQSGGIVVSASKRVTVADATLANAQHRGGGGNGYLFEVRASSEVLFRDSVGRNGRHNFIQNWGFGTSGWVLLRVASMGGEALHDETVPVGTPGASEFHHSLAMADLVDQSTFHDAFQAVNRGQESSGAGHTSTEAVLWNSSGAGYVRSLQFGHGYVIGTAPTLAVLTLPALPGGEGTVPEDWTEGLGTGGLLEPPSLYEDMLARRRG